MKYCLLVRDNDTGDVLAHVAILADTDERAELHLARYAAVRWPLRVPDRTTTQANTITTYV